MLQQMVENNSQIATSNTRLVQRVIADIIKSSKDELVGFLDDNQEIKDKVIFEDKKVLGTTQEEDVKNIKIIIL